jgi:hypothetical protein
MWKIGSVYRLRLRGRGWYTTKRTLDKRRTIVRRVAAKTTVFAANTTPLLFLGNKMLRNFVAFFF